MHNDGIHNNVTIVDVGYYTLVILLSDGATFKVDARDPNYHAAAIKCFRKACRNRQHIDCLITNGYLSDWNWHI